MPKFRQHRTIQGETAAWRKKQQEYGNDSIRQLKGADRVSKRPAVILGSDGVEGCARSILKIIVSNSIDEARDGHGNRVDVTLYPDHVVEVEGLRAAASRWTTTRLRTAGTGTLSSASCTPAANTPRAAATTISAWASTAWACVATQYASEWMTADIYRDGCRYHLDFKKGENVGGLQKEPFKGKRTGSGHPLETGHRGLYRHRRPGRQL